MKPVVLCILDGVGIREEIHGNAFKQAKKDNFDYLWNNYPHSLLEASGELVGLPAGQMGNSEVGHITIGAGRIIDQPLQLVTKAIKNGEIFHNENILEVINHTKQRKSKLHLLGLISDGGVHSHLNHLLSLIDMCKKEDIEEVYIHLFLDGRDTPPRSSYQYIKKLEEKIEHEQYGIISTISGRYYAMDRDNKWERIKLAYDNLTLGNGKRYSNSKEAIDSSYDNGIDDEFVIPCVINENGLIKENDGLIVFNFRPDRLKELFSALTNPHFNQFERPFINDLKLVTMLPVSNDLVYKHAFKMDKIDNTLGSYISHLGLKQLRIAETEKYAHVTRFFDGEGDLELDNCDKLLIPSPKVATYDLKPEMSAYQITEKLLPVMGNYDLIILNYANCDMVGHTGDMATTIKAVETVDQCLGMVYKKVETLGGTLLVTADHGNSEYMIDEKGNKVTSHSTNKVPLIINQNKLLKDGKLSDLAPTILRIMKIDIPKEMTGDSLIID
ncbi:MAG: 2,3-bisphosphoglycerate-independent phosphoglycerate mutase [Bacilli bacterium]|nr:2,3-bisphosphoglycerate-independent phosphoglycerate mutase [Bacilli bacterium]MDD4809270.1 2,3-bisphosphoglycerate-independent phosphoglycerate mutase [Bacilli bacterium]